MTILVVLMVLDYLTALILVLIHKRQADSRVGYKGILRKAMIPIVVGVIYLVEDLIKYDGLHQVCLLFFSINETVSILENIAEMGVKLPIGLISLVKGEEPDVKHTKELDGSELQEE